MATKRPPSGGLQSLHDRYIGHDSEMKAALDRARADADVAQMIHDLRTGAGLSQRQLAALVGTDASVICRLEDADYEGHSLSMLRRVAAALGRRVQVRFVPIKRTKAARATGLPVKDERRGS